MQYEEYYFVSRMVVWFFLPRDEFSSSYMITSNQLSTVWRRHPGGGRAAAGSQAASPYGWTGPSLRAGGGGTPGRQAGGRGGTVGQVLTAYTLNWTIQRRLRFACWAAGQPGSRAAGGRRAGGTPQAASPCGGTGPRLRAAEGYSSPMIRERYPAPSRSKGDTLTT